MTMVFELSLGFVMIILAMMLHLGATILIVRTVRPLEVLIKSSPYVFIAATLMLTNLIFFVTHLIGVALWALVYLYLNLAADFSSAFYSAFIMNTTLGLGLINAEIGTRLLAPLTASSGIMMIGWSTAVYIYVVQSYLPHIARHD
ncbi:hypothetical protein [Xanthobacter pseudotagetidis]|uniref:hypothetical protein n=1 Tax=Xanthobacter pseudotagetidis TaxID=3119911 RepID=UPI0037290269